MITATYEVIDWRSPIDSLLSHLLNAGVVLVAVEHEDRIEIEGLPETKARALAIAELTACDEAYLFVRCPDGMDCTLWVILGNSYSELIADYTVNDYLDRVTGAFYQSWEGRGYQKTHRHACQCQRTGKPFLVYKGERTDVHPRELRADFAKVKEAYFEITGYTESTLESLNMTDEDIEDLHIGTYNTAHEFARWRILHQFKEECHHSPLSRLPGFLIEFLDWDRVEEEVFSSVGYGYEKVLLDGKVYVFDGNAA